MPVITEQVYMSPTGQTYYVRALSEQDSPQMTVVVTCLECCLELARHTFDVRDPNADIQAAACGIVDSVNALGHDCPKGGTC